MKSNQNSSTLIQSKDFLQLIGKYCQECPEDATPEGLKTFLREHIFPSLGKVSVEIYFYRNIEKIFVPEQESAQRPERISTDVPLKIPGEGRLFEEFRSNRLCQVFNRDSAAQPFFATTGNISHALFPIFMGERLTAILYVGSKELPAFPDDYLLGIQTLTVMIGSRLKSMDIILGLKKSTTILEDSDQLQQALYAISEQAHLVPGEEDLYRSLHNIVGRLLNARNFFIALRQERDGEHYIKFAYYCDEFDSYLQGMEFKIDPTDKLSMSGFIVQSGKPVLLGPENFDEFCKVNNIQPLGTKAHSLVGVPFYLEHLAGVVLVQNYHEEVYTDKDKDLLVYVARHIGDALNRKKAIDDIYENEQRYRIIFEKTPLAVISFDAHGTIVDFNEKFVEMMGSSREKLLGFNTVRQSSPKMQQTIKKALAGEIASFEGSYTSITGGKTTSLRGIFSPVTPGHSPTAVIATLEDITELKKHEKELQKIEKLESLGILAGGIAHDFNNILTGIMGNISFSQVLIEREHRAHKPLEEAAKASKRAAELAQQLLTFARGGEPNKKVVSLQRLTRDAVSLMLRGANVRSVVRS